MKLEDRGLDLDRLWDMEASEIGSLLRHPAAGKTIAACLEAFPALQLDAQLQPITRCIRAPRSCTSLDCKLSRDQSGQLSRLLSRLLNPVSSTLGVALRRDGRTQLV